MFKRCLIFVLLLAGVGCAWGQEDWEKWAWVSSENLNINYEEQSWSSWDGSRTIYLWGEVYVVRPGEKADLDVRIVNGTNENADIDVMLLDNDKYFMPGQWLFVGDRRKADFSIRFVDRDEHFTVRFISRAEWVRQNTNHMGIPVIWHNGK